MITLEMMPPLMFGGLILAMLIGFPVAFTLAALGLIVYLSSGDAGPQAGDVEVVAEGRAPMVLTTQDGPVVLLGDPSDGDGT